MKTKILSRQYSLILLTLLVLFPFNASAYNGPYDICLDGIYYELIYRGMKVVGVESGIQDVIIPTQVEYKNTTYLVKVIGGHAFGQRSDIISVTIPTSVTKIEGAAFYECSSLTSVAIPPSVTNIGGAAFSGCTSLTSITIPPSVTYIGDGAFSGCSSLASVTMPPSVSYIGEEAFSGCSSLTSMTIPPSVTYIGRAALSGSSVKELIVEDGTEILTIEDDLGGPLEILYLGRNINDSSGLGSSRCPFNDSPKLKSLTIGKCVTKINDRAFTGCSSLTSLIIGESVTSIEEYAFEGCSSLTSLIIGESVTSIGERAFEGCSSLCSLTIPKSVARIEAWAFEGCRGLKELVIEDGIETLSIASACLFGDCPLETLYLGRNLPLKTFCDSPFGDGQNPMVVSIGKPVTSVDKYLFEFRNIKSIAFYSFNIKGIENCGLDSDTPVTLCTKSDFSGIGNTNLTYFKKITVIKDSNSYGLVRSKVNLNFSKYLYAEGDLYIMPLETCHASWTDTAIKTVFRGEEITDILNNPNGFDFIPSEYHYDNYFGVYGSPDNPSLVKVIELESAGSLLNELELNDLDRIEALIIKGNVDGTDIMTINRMSNLKYLDISNANIVAGGETYRDNLKTENDVIGTRFFDDINLELLYLPNSAKTISDMAFYDMPFYYGAELCSGDLRCIRLGNSINTIGNMAFWGCSGLTSVNVPKTVVAIGSNAFLDCTRLAAVNIDDLESWCKIDFQDYNANPLSYAHHLFLNGEEVHDLIIPSSIVSIKDNAFVGCSGLTSLSIPNTVVSIGDNAFCGTSIKEVLLTSSVKKIGYRAFGSNTDITKVVSLNPTPPEIDPRTFDSKVLESATLYVPRGSLKLYFIDPVWKEFKNISDDVLCLPAIPNARYGDGEIDLSQYAPEGVALTYQSSNEDVVRINGSSMQIVGAGEATIAAMLDEDGPTTELVGQLRSIVVDKADLTVSVKEIVIEEGSPIPDFTYLAEGLQYDDTLDDIDNLPQPVHDVDENSPKGEYMVSFTEGSDRNYRISTKPSKITVTERSGVEDNLSADGEQDIEVYDLNGLCIYHGIRNGVILGKGIYIVRQGDTVKKVIVK